MSLSNTPSGERVHIGFFGRRNAGKSSLVNKFTSQDVSLVSDIKGTTTDTVKKTMELLPLGPVVIYDTAGIDDDGELGMLRVEKAYESLESMDIAVIVIDVNEGISHYENELIKKLSIPYILAFNKIDKLDPLKKEKLKSDEFKVYISALTGEGLDDLKKKLSNIKLDDEGFLIKDIVKKNDNIMMVIPIDSSAPKGRIILPQQMLIREALDIGACITLSKDTELLDSLDKLKEAPSLIVTDSQVFKEVSDSIDKDLPLTSFSILQARYKGFLGTALKGIEALKNLKEGDYVLISEACTHHRMCNDIGTVKIPRLLRKHLGFKINFDTSSGDSFPKDLDKYALVIHCGACMINRRKMMYRRDLCLSHGVPMTNYGVLLAYINGILKRSTEMFQDA